MKASSSRERSPVPLSRKSILLLDDDSDLCEMLETLLKCEGYEVAVAHRGVDAVKLILKRDYDAVICDTTAARIPSDMFYLAVEHAKPRLCNRFIFIAAHTENRKLDQFLNTSSGATLYEPLGTIQLLTTINQVTSQVENLDYNLTFAASKS